MCAAIAVSSIPKVLLRKIFLLDSDKKPQVQTVAVHLPVLCVATNKNSCGKWNYPNARLKHASNSVSGPEQQKVFLEALPDILDYEEPVTANKKHLFDVLKSISI
jgi:hypothetical protein